MSAFLLLLLLGLLAVWLAVRIGRYVIHCHRLSKIPMCPVLKRHWLLGHVPAVIDRQKLWYELLPTIQRIAPKIRRFFLGPFPVVNVSDYETAWPVLRSLIPKNQMIFALAEPFIGKLGVLTTDGKKWSRDRALLNNIFHGSIMPDYTAVFHTASETFLEKLKSHASDPFTAGKPLDFSRSCSMLTLDSIIRCIIGWETDCQTVASDYSDNVQVVTDLVIRRATSPFMFLPNWMYYLSEDGRRFKKACDSCHEFSGKMIAQRRDELKALLADAAACGSGGNGGDDGSGGESLTPIQQVRQTKGKVDFLDILLLVRDTDGNGLSDQEIRDQVDTFLIAGHDTTASCLQWLFYHLAKNPQFQDQCREEARAFVDSDGHVSHDDLHQLTYITQCIKECLRIVSPIPFVERCLAEPMKLHGHKLPAGTMVHVGIFAMHHDCFTYPAPFEFDPGRFAANHPIQRDPHAFIPFSAGPRNCIGQNVAMNEMKVVVAAVLSRFRLSVDDEQPEPRLHDALAMQAKPAIQLVVKFADDDNTA